MKKAEASAERIDPVDGFTIRAQHRKAFIFCTMLRNPKLLDPTFRHK
jgi:hypothetical protein